MLESQAGGIFLDSSFAGPYIGNNVISFAGADPLLIYLADSAPVLMQASQVPLP